MSKKYKIVHTTTYEYGDMVPVCQNTAHLTPRSTPLQSLSYHRLQVHPAPQQTGKRVDYFGNHVATFAILHGHRRMVVTAVSKVTVTARTGLAEAMSPPWEAVRDELPRDRSRFGLDTYQFCFPSRHIPLLPALREYAAPSFPSGRPVLEAVLDLTRRIHCDIAYDPSATTISTPVEEVLQLRRGVCQDLAHLEIGCLRSMGLAARYVSGYLRTYAAPGQRRLVGADASHAWLAVYCREAGWVDLDPTNNLAPGEEHITVAWGCDYSDVCPISGVFTGGGQHAMHVAVDVEPLEDPRA